MSEQDDEFKENIVRQLKELLARRNVFHSAADLDLLIETTNIIYDRGHRYTYLEVLDFATNETNLKYVSKEGLAFVLKRIPNMKMPPIRKRPRPGRNDLCNCGSKRKFKNCCIGKTLAN